MPVHVVPAKDVVRSGERPMALCGAKVEGLFLRTLKGVHSASKHVCPACRELAARPVSPPRG